MPRPGAWSPSDAVKMQKLLAEKVISSDALSNKLSTVCAFDASYGNNTAFCSAIVVQGPQDTKGFDIIESVDNQIKISEPYIPGLFVLREGRPALETIKKVKADFDLVLIDGHGVLHPRKCGLASYVGVKLDVPTIGVAKSLLCGQASADGYVEYHGEILGFALGEAKKVYVSTGHRISLETAISVVRAFTKEGDWLPYPLRIADQRSRLLRKAQSFG